MNENTEKESTEQKIARMAQAIIIVYSTIVAVEGLCIYAKRYTAWIDRKFEKIDNNVLTIVPDENK